MNPKFFDVKKEKQDAIINAALMVFAENGYRKASTDVIVKEAGISKGLLFHYFISKKGVYEFVYDYSIKYMLLELTQTVRKDEKDFFSIQRMIELAKTRVMKNYPYMQQFLSSAKYETHPDALGVIKESEGVIEDTYNGIYKKADMSRFSSPVDLHKITRLIGWMSDGYIKDKFRDGTPDLDEMNAEFAGYLSMLRDHFYKDSEKPEEDVAAESITERDDSVMDSLREEMMNRPQPEEEKPAAKEPELSFEERLAAGRKSAYDALAAEDEAVTDETEEHIGEEEEASAEPAAEESAEVRPEESADDAEPETVTYEEPDEIPEAAADDREAEEETVAADDSEAENEIDSAKPAGEAPAEEPVSEEAPVEEEVSDGPSEEEQVKEEQTEEEPHHEVTISVDYFEGGYKVYDGTQGSMGDETYAASPTVTSYIPASDLAFYEESRLGDFTYGSDSRGGRGIPYDSSENIQIFVTDDDEGSAETTDALPDLGNTEAAEESSDEPDVNTDNGFDISDLSEKIMSNTDRETAEDERNRELEKMGPAPVLPDFTPDNVKRRNTSIDEEDEENMHIYRPLKF
ncbi:MAG: TetR family transcriptional regulator [Lachnospiraceae bacterium]|nr:TetR family transcriptional regulator [Lachnospiraceae bacterium]